MWCRDEKCWQQVRKILNGVPTVRISLDSCHFQGHHSQALYSRQPFVWSLLAFCRPDQSVAIVMLTINDGLKVGRVANLGTLLVSCISTCQFFTANATLSTYIGVSRFPSVEHYHLLPISCIHWKQFASTSCSHLEAGASQ
jgi:hypothetical protein